MICGCAQTNIAVILQLAGVYAGMGTDFEKKNSNLSGDTADFTPPPPNLGQDFMQPPVIDMCPSKVLHWLPKNCLQQPFMKTEDFSNAARHSRPGCSAEEIFRKIAS